MSVVCVALRFNSALQPTAAPLPSTGSLQSVVALAAAERLGRWADGGDPGDPDHATDECSKGEPS